MLILQTLAVVILVVAGFLLLLYIVEPSLLSLPFTLFLKLVYKNPPYLDADKYFPEHKLLEAHADEIRCELEEILKNEANIPRFHEIDKIQTRISDVGESPWRVFVFKAYDNWVEGNCEKAPKTVALLRQIPTVTTAMFSILGPKKHIPPHIGLYKGILRYHLGLIVPKSAPCYIVVAGQKYQWEEGKGVLLDDTYLHHVYNESDETRVVLFCDVYRNDLPGPFNWLNRVVYKMRERSKRLKKAIARAEVQQALE